MVITHTTTKGRVMESAGRREGSVQARTVGVSTLGVDRVVADKAPAY
ncbi:MAG: hypothetical protein ACREQ7_24890 [Candidatus Binatia bacterium]